MPPPPTDTRSPGTSPSAPSAFCAVNQTLPSGAGATSCGWEPAGTGYSWISHRTSGEMAFRCEVPFPGASDRVRVFEARDTSEIKLMTAVAEAAEKWVGTQKAGN